MHIIKAQITIQSFLMSVNYKVLFILVIVLTAQLNGLIDSHGQAVQDMVAITSQLGIRISDPCVMAEGEMRDYQIMRVLY